MSRPDRYFDTGLQHERTALAWERTAIATMVAGTLLARYGAEASNVLLVPVGLGQVVFGALVLVWAARHYDDLHGTLRAGTSPVHRTAAGFVGAATTVCSGLAVVGAVARALG